MDIKYLYLYKTSINLPTHNLYVLLVSKRLNISYYIENAIAKVVFLYNFSYLCSMRKIITYKSYFSDFIKRLSKDEVNKIRRALDLFKVEDKMPRHFIKFIRDGIYEFRVTYGSNEFRIFFIYDGDTVVVLFNAFKKKTQKTPNDEIEKALKLKEEYYDTKRNQERHL